MRMRLAASLTLLSALGGAACQSSSGGLTSSPAPATATDTPAIPALPPPASAAPAATASAEAPPAAPDTIIAQHILIAYKTAKRAPTGVPRSKAEAKARAAEALAKVQSGPPFADPVKADSDDGGSADRLPGPGKLPQAGLDPPFA